MLLVIFLERIEFSPFLSREPTVFRYISNLFKVVKQRLPISTVSAVVAKVDITVLNAGQN